MASVNIKKHNSTSSAKVMLHNDKDDRAKDERNHANKHINKQLTANNKQVFDQETANMRKKERLDELDAHPKANKRKDRIVDIAFEAPIPEFVPEAKRIAFVNAFNRAVCECANINSRYLINSYLHVDEVHEYVDSETSLSKTSLTHVHTHVIPAFTNEDGSVSLNAKKVYDRGLPNRINQAMDDYCMKTYNKTYRDGTKKKGKSVESVKKVSAELGLMKQEQSVLSKQLREQRLKLMQMENEQSEIEKQEKRLEELRKEQEELKHYNTSLQSESEAIKQSNDKYVPIDKVEAYTRGRAIEAIREYTPHANRPENDERVTKAAANAVANWPANKINNASRSKPQRPQRQSQYER